MRFRLIAILAVVAALAVACGDADQAAAPDPPPATQAPVPTTHAPVPTTQAPVPTTQAPVPTTQAPVPTTQAPVPTTQAPVPTTQAPALPGEPWELGPEQGASLGVVTVAHDDVLNVRRRPGVGHEIVARLEPLATGVIATGNARQLDSGAIWLEVDARGTVGWANLRYLSRLADTVDATAGVVQHHGGRPSAPSMGELGMIIADGLRFDDSVKVVLVAAPRAEHDIGEVTYDVVGFGDDSLSGVRLHVFGRLSDDRQSFSLHSVEETAFCFRGVTPEGLCA